MAVTNDDDEDPPPSQVPVVKPQNTDLLLPDRINRGPVGNMLNRMHNRDRTRSLEVETELLKAGSEYHRATQELASEAQKTRIAAALYNQETPAIIEDMLATARHEREQRARQRVLEEAKSRESVADVNDRIQHSRNRRRLNEETLTLRAELGKALAEINLTVALSSSEQRQKAQIEAEIEALKKGDIQKLRALQNARHLTDERSSPSDRDPEEIMKDLEVQLAFIEKMLADAIDREDDPNHLAALTKERKRILDELEKARASENGIP